MRVCLAVHSVISCWNNGNAHFLRGVAAALDALGHEVHIVEPAVGWSRTNLVADAGEGALNAITRAFPRLRPQLYRSVRQAVEAVEAADPDLVLVHEWNDPALVAALSARRNAGAPYVLLFHDTHHRAASAPDELRRMDLSGFDGVLAFGACIAEVYERRGWGRRVWVWHEAADVRRFRPLDDLAPESDVVWVGNWGDGERSEEIRALLLAPVAELGLGATVHGVRYPPEALAALRASNVTFGGWIANHEVPAAFARHRATVHVPRRPYVKALPGIPTIRVFEALACGIPLVSAPWDDVEGLFPEGAFLKARDGTEVARHLRSVLADRDLGAALRAIGLAAIADRHTCDHRAAELLAIVDEISPAAPVMRKAAS